MENPLKMKGILLVVNLAKCFVNVQLGFIFRKFRFIMQIKSLAAELCLDRALVLQLLREPPPNLLMMSAALPDEPAPTISVMETKPVETAVEITAEPDTRVKVPVHDLQQKFSAQKRVKKVHVQTLESIYRRTKRPTVSEVSSTFIFQVSNRDLPLTSKLCMFLLSTWTISRGGDITY